MRLTQIIQVAFLVAAAGSVSAQDWVTIKFIDDGFRANFPGEPTIEPITYDTEMDMQLPGRVYHAADALGDYSTTVVDYRTSQQLHDEHSNRCRAADGANQLDGDTCQNNFEMEVLGAIDHAAAGFLTREGVEVTQFGTYFIDRVLGREMRLTNADGSRTYVGIHQHTGRLYIHQATVPVGFWEGVSSRRARRLRNPRTASWRFSNRVSASESADLPPPFSGQSAPIRSPFPPSLGRWLQRASLRKGVKGCRSRRRTERVSARVVLTRAASAASSLPSPASSPSLRRNLADSTYQSQKSSQVKR